MKRRRKRTCRGCGDGFHPSPQNRDKQRYCRKAECTKISAKTSNERWKAQNPDYFKGPENVLRVTRWREAHPGYWRRKKGVLGADALQDDCIAQMIDNQDNSGELKHFALQENWFSQPTVIVGLIANLTDNALQEDIVRTVVNLQKRGQEILGTRSGIFTEAKTQTVHEKENPRSLAPAARSGPVQLGRSPPDPAADAVPVL